MIPIALIIPIYYEENNVIPLLSKISISIKAPIKVYFIYDEEKDPTI